jgi:DNA-binding response OmpR family regulator
MSHTILIVDDEPVARDALAKLLGARGFDVRTAGDSQEAIRQMGESPAETVLLDLGLPHVPGESVASFLQIRHPKTRIIFMSGQYEMVDCERFGENTLYFRKPLDLTNLLEVLQQQASSTTTT